MWLCCIALKGKSRMVFLSLVFRPQRYESPTKFQRALSPRRDQRLTTNSFQQRTLNIKTLLVSINFIHYFAGFTLIPINPKAINSPRHSTADIKVDNSVYFAGSKPAAQCMGTPKPATLGHQMVQLNKDIPVSEALGEHTGKVSEWCTAT